MPLLFLAALAFPQAPAEEEKAGRAAVEALVAAMNDNKGADFVALFDVDRMAREIRAQAGADAALPPLEGLLKIGLGAMVAQQHALTAGWGELRAFRLRRAADGTEAEAACVLKDVDGEKDRMRFWLTKHDAGWRIFDFESVSDGLRVSVILGAMLVRAGAPGAGGGLQKAGRALQKAMAELGGGDLDAALTALQAVDRASLPDSLAPFIDLMEGAVLAELERPEEALERLDRSLTKKPDLPRALRMKAELCLELERHEDAVKAEQAFVGIIPDDPQAFVNMGAALLALGKLDAAEEALRKGTACDGEDVESRLQLGLLLAGRGRADEAKRFLLEGLTRSEDPESDYDRVAEELQTGAAAGLLLDLAAEEAKTRPEAVAPQYHQGHALRRLGRFEEAEKALRRAEELDADGDWTIELLEELACVLGHRGKPEEAREMAARLEGQDEKAASLYVEAYLLALGGPSADAEKAIDDALDLDDDLHAKFGREPVFEALRARPAVRDRLTAAKAKSEYASKALEHFWRDRHEPLRALAEARVRAAPEDADAWYDLGYALRRLGRHDAALKALRTGLEKEASETRRPRFWQELGQALARGGRPREALPWAEKLLAEENWQGEGHALAATAHAFLDDLPAALSSLTKHLEADPDALDDVEEDPAFQELRRDPGYAALRERIRRKRASEE